MCFKGLFSCAQLSGGNDVASAVVRIWYSVLISEQDFTLLMSAVQDLVVTAELSTITDGKMEVSASQLTQLRTVWATWLRLSERKGPWVAELRKTTNSLDSERKDGIRHYIYAIPKEHRVSAQHFFDTGIFHSTTNAKELTRQNPTLTGSSMLQCSSTKEFQYNIPSDVSPFTGWDYKAIKKIYYDKSLPNMYILYISNILKEFSRKITSGRVKFHFILCDFLKIDPYLPADLSYDRITTSNLWDYYPLRDLLTKFKRVLNSANPHSVMLTESQNWLRNYMPEIIYDLPYNEGIEELCATALKDTKNIELVDLSGLTTVVEYLNLTDEFLRFLRATLLASYTDQQFASLKRKLKIPSVKCLVRSLGLHLRDFVQNENTVSPYKWAINCRRVVMMRGHERVLEWTLVSDSVTESTAE